MREAERADLPATTLAQEAIDSWLRERARQAGHTAIAAYATEMAGADLYLDRDLESAGIQHPRKTNSDHDVHRREPRAS